MIRSVVFDFGRVIARPRPPACFRAYERRLGLPAGTINRIMFDSTAWQAALLGRLSMQGFWTAIGPALNLTCPAAVDAFRRRYYQDEAADPGVVALIRRLHGDYRLGVLSNHPPGLDEWLRAWRIRRFFDVVYCSGDEGRIKPDPVVFHVTLDRLAVRPEEAVFIDDTPEHVAAARAVGLHGIVFTDARKLRVELDRLLTAPPPVPVE